MPRSRGELLRSGGEKNVPFGGADPHENVCGGNRTYQKRQGFGGGAPHRKFHSGGRAAEFRPLGARGRALRRARISSAHRPPTGKKDGRFRRGDYPHLLARAGACAVLGIPSKALSRGEPFGGLVHGGKPCAFGRAYGGHRRRAHERRGRNPFRGEYRR